MKADEKSAETIKRPCVFKINRKMLITGSSLPVLCLYVNCKGFFSLLLYASANRSLSYDQVINTKNCLFLSVNMYANFKFFVCFFFSLLYAFANRSLSHDQLINAKGFFFSFLFNCKYSLVLYELKQETSKDEQWVDWR